MIALCKYAVETNSSQRATLSDDRYFCFASTLYKSWWTLRKFWRASSRRSPSMHHYENSMSMGSLDLILAINLVIKRHMNIKIGKPDGC